MNVLNGIFNDINNAFKETSGFDMQKVMFDSSDAMTKNVN